MDTMIPESDMAELEHAIYCWQLSQLGVIAVTQSPRMSIRRYRQARGLTVPATIEEAQNTGLAGVVQTATRRATTLTGVAPMRRPA